MSGLAAGPVPGVPVPAGPPVPIPPVPVAPPLPIAPFSGLPILPGPPVPVGVPGAGAPAVLPGLTIATAAGELPGCVGGDPAVMTKASGCGK
jgi:hypothetical protein